MSEEEILSALRKEIPKEQFLTLLETLNRSPDKITKCDAESFVEAISTHFLNLIGTNVKIKSIKRQRMKDLSAYYDRQSSTIFVNPISLVKDLSLYQSCAGVDPIDALFYVFMHEYGHHQINMMKIKPMDVDSRVYYAIYFKFEDLVISKFLRTSLYRSIETKILSFNALRSYESLAVGIVDDLFEWRISYLARSLITRLMSNIATVALASVLGYIDLGSLKVSIPKKIIDTIRVIAFYMQQVSEDRIELIPDIAYRACFECYKNL